MDLEHLEVVSRGIFDAWNKWDNNPARWADQTDETKMYFIRLAIRNVQANNKLVEKYGMRVYALAIVLRYQNERPACIAEGEPFIKWEAADTETKDYWCEMARRQLA